jgi:hypothetical protein
MYNFKSLDLSRLFLCLKYKLPYPLGATKGAVKFIVGGCNTKTVIFGI